jgi:sigma-E factor negative regulatory protein RseB
MLWLYWRRVRLAALAAGLATSGIAALVIGAAFLAGSGQSRNAGLGGGWSGTEHWRGGRPSAGGPGGGRGLRLMEAAVAACQTVSYRGDQMVAWWWRGGATTYHIQVWHRPGGPALADGDDESGARTGGGQSGGPEADDGHVVAGVLSVSPWMLALMRSNYVIAYAGPGSASRRPALIVTLRHRGGVLAARYWLDRETSLPLRRQVYDSGGRLVNEAIFTDLTIGRADLGDVPPPSVNAWSSSPAVTAVVSLRKQGWIVPVALAGNLALVAVTTSSNRPGAVVDASYSDGLSVVSVFMQRGALPRILPGWQQTDVGGMAVYSGEPDERSLAWSAQGIVYTVIADAPQETVDGVVAALPHDQSIGFWQRVGRGLGRIGSWFDPFS